MDRAMWSFLLNSPQNAVPYPWERCYDMLTDILFYKNGLNGTVVIDLRTRVDLGDGLYHVNNMWRDLKGCTCTCTRHCPVFQLQYRQEIPHIVHAACCGPSVYLLLPEMMNRCPICHDQLTYIHHTMT